jgi:uncharacterized protein YidB (DUF937 family)
MLEDLLAGAVSGRGTGAPAPQPRSGGIGGLGGSGALAALLPIVLAMLANRGGQRAPSGGGGGLGDVLGQVLGSGRGSGGAGGGLGDILGQVLGGGAGAGSGNGDLGGLGGLLEKLNQGGYSQHTQSWVGTGQNMSLPANAIRDVFGQHGVTAIAKHAGLSEDETSAGLAQLLPEIINHVTPQGRVPQAGELDSKLEGLLKQLTR